MKGRIGAIGLSALTTGLTTWPTTLATSDTMGIPDLLILLSPSTLGGIRIYGQLAPNHGG